MERKGAIFFEKVRAGFLAEARRRPDKIRIIDATQPAEMIHERMWHEVDEWLRS